MIVEVDVGDILIDKWPLDAPSCALWLVIRVVRKRGKVTFRALDLDSGTCSEIHTRGYMPGIDLLLKSKAC